MVTVLTVLLLGGVPFAGAASNYPDKPIRLVVPFAAGGVSDIIGRSLAQKMSELLGQNVIVDNRGGAGGMLGTNIVAKGTPDGYSIVLSSVATQCIAPNLLKKILPNVTTFREAGFPEVALHFWIALHGPADVPPAIVQKLNQTLLKALASNALRERFANVGAEPYFSSPQELAVTTRNDYERLAKVIKAAGIQPE